MPAPQYFRAGISIPSWGKGCLFMERIGCRRRTRYLHQNPDQDRRHFQRQRYRQRLINRFSTLHHDPNLVKHHLVKLQYLALPFERSKVIQFESDTTLIKDFTREVNETVGKAKVSGYNSESSGKFSEIMEMLLAKQELLRLLFIFLIA